MKKILPFVLLIAVILIFFWQFLFKGFLPIPSDTIVGLYYPFRDAYFKTNPNGLPYKNFLITDPVRQQIPWKNLAIDLEKNIQLPLWNPYNFAGTPLLANFQSAVLYPLNILFLFLPFTVSWSLLILLQPILAGIFLYLYLTHLKLKKTASFLGAISFAFSGFFIAWLEWGTVVNTALWLPLILLAIDKIFESKNKILAWSLIFIFSLVSSFFAGHLQTFAYLLIFVLVYFLARWFQYGRKTKSLGLFLLLGFVSLVLILPQLIPTLQFIALSARNLDLPTWQTNSGWFIPWQNLIQFLAPDFFGNPTTLNYYGAWNYGEFIGYIGILPLVMALFALFFRRDKKTFLFGSIFFFSLIFAMPTFLAKIPFQLNLPFISTAQPTRLLFITDFSLSVLAALGIDYFILSKNKKQIGYALGALFLILIALWSFVLFFRGDIVSIADISVSKQNLILPTILFIVVSTILVIIIRSPKRIISLLFGLLLLITIFDLFRFGWKFETFTKSEYFFPSTQITTFLQNQKQPFRVISTDSRIFPPNFSIMYRLQTIDGYDPLYLQRFGELMVALKREKPEVSSPFGFNRIITLQNPSSRIVDLLGVKYVLSLDELNNPKLKQVFTDNVVRVYENIDSFPRAFFVSNTLSVDSKQEAINAIFSLQNSLNKTAILEGVQNNFKTKWGMGKAEIVKYEANRVEIKTNNQVEGFLVLTDSYYPTWHAKIDGKETKIYLTDYSFRGIVVSKGEHRIEFYNSLF